MDAYILRGIIPFQDIEIVDKILSVGDVLYAAVLAFILLGVFRAIRFIWRLFMVKHIRIGDVPEDFALLLTHCKRMFPIESVSYKDKTFTRGMTVRITLSMNKSFVGEFIGMNADNVVCVVSKDVVAADKLESIKDLEVASEE